MKTITVYYDLSQNGFKDDEAREAAGKSENGSGTFLPTMTRDLSFTFKTEQKAAEAKKRLKKAGFRFTA